MCVCVCVCNKGNGSWLEEGKQKQKEEKKKVECTALSNLNDGIDRVFQNIGTKKCVIKSALIK